jgi:predicted DNA-binding transcriptional regulator AlpA
LRAFYFAGPPLFESAEGFLLRTKKKKKAKRAKPALPFLIAKNAAHRRKAALAPDIAPHQHDRGHVHGPRAPPPVRLLTKRQVIEITGVAFSTLWIWMRDGRFPRARVVGDFATKTKSFWLSSEIDAWLVDLPVRPLKGDVPANEEAAGEA